MPPAGLPTVQEDEIRSLYAQRIGSTINRTRALTAVGAIASIAIAAQVAVIAVQAGLALAATAAIGVGAVTAWRLLPLYLAKIENRKTEWLQAEMNRHLADHGPLNNSYDIPPAPTPTAAAKH